MTKMTPIEQSQIAGFSSTEYFGIKGEWLTIAFFKDYQQLWHVPHSKNFTVRIRIAGWRQFFLWIKR